MKSVITAIDDCLVVEVFTWQYLEVSTPIAFILSWWIMSKDFKVYITINNIIGEKRIDLAYPVQDKEATVVSVFSDNGKYELRILGH